MATSSIMRAMQCLAIAVATDAQQLRGASAASLGNTSIDEFGQQVRSSRKENNVFLWISDPHVDPLYGYLPENGPGGQECKKSVKLTKPNVYGMLGCDPPRDLIVSAAVAAAKEAANKLEFVLFSGDFTRHSPNNFLDPWGNVTSTVHEVAKIIIEKTSASIVGYNSDGKRSSMGTLGNNDSPLNYFLNLTTYEAENPWLSSVAVALESAEAMRLGLTQIYSYGMFFEQEVGGLTVIQINTIVYSVAHKSDIVDIVPEDPEDPFTQFQWLRSRLQAAVDENRTVWIVGHIPPGIETYGYSELWEAQYVEKYLSIVQDPMLGSIIAAQLFGHAHKEEFRLLPKPPPSAGPILLTTAISPIFYNNPAFRYVEYDAAAGRPTSFRDYYTVLPMGSEEPQWHEGYDLVSSYTTLQEGVEEMGGVLFHSQFERLAEVMKAGGKEWVTYSNWYQTQFRNDLQGCSEVTNPDYTGEPMNQTEKLLCRQQYLCALTISTQDQYDKCAETPDWQKQFARRKKWAQKVQNATDDRDYYHFLKNLRRTLHQ